MYVNKTEYNIYPTLHIELCNSTKLQSMHFISSCLFWELNPWLAVWVKWTLDHEKAVTYSLNCRRTDTFRVLWHDMTHLKAWPSLMLPYASEMLKTLLETGHYRWFWVYLLFAQLSISVPLCNRIFTAIMPMVAAGLIADDPTLQPIRRLISLVRPFGGSPLCSLLF